MLLMLCYEGGMMTTIQRAEALVSAALPQAALCLSSAEELMQLVFSELAHGQDVLVEKGCVRHSGYSCG